MKKFIKYAGLTFLLVAVACLAGEWAARSILGLGTPPLSIAHPRIEYMFKPDQDVLRFGHRLLINHYGMRSEPFAARHGKNEFRVMVFGDSVVFGGAQTDQADLATTLLRKKLAAEMGKDVVVGNISAGGWGACHWLAYAQEYGFFAADVVILVISSHDYADNRTFQPLDKLAQPTEPPVSALLEGIERYLPRYLPKFLTSGSETQLETDHFQEPPEPNIERGLRDLRQFLVLAREHAGQVVVFQHWEQSEIRQGNARAGNQRIGEICASLNIPTIQLAPYYSQAIQQGENPYRDNIHLNALGQRIMAEAFYDFLTTSPLKGRH